MALTPIPIVQALSTALPQEAARWLAPEVARRILVESPEQSVSPIAGKEVAVLVPPGVPVGAVQLPVAAYFDASLFFRLVVRRCERASTVITSSTSLLDWGEVLSDAALTTAILGRLLHYSTTLNATGASYRLKEKRRAGLLGLPSRRRPAQRRWKPNPEHRQGTPCPMIRGLPRPTI